VRFTKGFSLDIREVSACVFRPLKSTMRMLFKQNSRKLKKKFINLRYWKKTFITAHSFDWFQSGADTRGMQGMHPPQPDLKWCWHDTWFHWKSSPKYFCTAHYSL